MEFTELINAIANVGFPIGLSVYLIYSMNKMHDNFTAALDDIRKTVDNNTSIITRLYDRMGREE